MALPDGPSSPLPSDTYNQVAAHSPQARGNFGLFGNVPGILRPVLDPPTPLQPYAGDSARALLHSPSSMDEDAGLQLSQESDAPARPQHDGVSQRLFAGRMDAPHVARRKAAVAAIRAKAYKPPTAPAQALSTDTVTPVRQKTLFETWQLRSQQDTDMNIM